MKLESLRLPQMALATHENGLLKEHALVAILVLSALFWLFAWYWDTALSMISIWRRSDTFAHGFLIVPISGWLIWRQRHALAALELRPSPFALVLLAGAGFAWLLAELGEVGVVRQFAFVAMIPLALWTILGTSVVRALSFPLFFLFFAVPFGEFLEPVLMQHTADFTVAALKATGIPVYREGMFFTIPSGSWSIVEACSGLRYLIASITLGVLYAYLTYRSVARRALFVAASAIVPIVANWLRAYMIVMIGHLSNMAYAGGVDHLIYGWVFFGIVMLILFWIGSYWREDIEQPSQNERSHIPTPARVRTARSLGTVLLATVAAAGIAAAWPFAGDRIEELGAYRAPALEAPPGAAGWRRIEGGEVSNWTPRFYNFQKSVREVYSDGKRGAGLVIVYYRHQRPGAQLISPENTVVAGKDREWKKIGESRRSMDLGSAKMPLVETTLQGSSSRLLVWRWYWLDGQYLVSAPWAKLLQAKSKLLGHGDDAAAVMIYSLVEQDARAAEKNLHDFLRDMLPAITESLENARRNPASL